MPRYAADHSSKILFNLTFPNHFYSPAQSCQIFLFLSIAFYVPLEFWYPVFLVSFRHWKIAIGAPVPKTSIYKNGNHPSRISNIRMPRGFVPMQSVSWISCFTKCFPQNHFRLRIFAFVGFHHLGSDFTCRMGIWQSHCFSFFLSARLRFSCAYSSSAMRRRSSGFMSSAAASSI